MRVQQVPEVAVRADFPEAHTMIAAMPSPVWIIGTYDAYDRPNIMAASWCGVASSTPHRLSVSIKTGSFSAENIICSQAFSVCVPSANDCKLIDTIGTTSGCQQNKFALTGLTAVRFGKVNAPFVKEFTINIGCNLINAIALDSHTMFIGEVTEQIVSADIMKNGAIDMTLVAPVLSGAADRRYFTISAPIAEIKRYKK